ncbi:unnamed protein product [Cuscuta campestris]|uniref:Uncharacterized protein n=1 Tax=Cuscuta campestris TaxID=132261 RepID=A0A484LUY9_9ASTE|nr:unnamed protein product [Cuscuta campestris]
MGSSQSREKRYRKYYTLTTTTTTAATYETRAAATPSAHLTFGYDGDQVHTRATNVVTAVDRRSNGGAPRGGGGGGQVDHEDDDEYIDLKATEYIARVRERLRLQNESEDGLDNAVRSEWSAGGGSGGGGDMVSPPCIDAQTEAYISSIREKLLLENHSK